MPVWTGVPRGTVLVLALLCSVTRLLIDAVAFGANVSSCNGARFTSTLSGGFRLDCPTQPIQTAEGAEVILQCRLHPALDLTACAVDVRRPDLQVQDNVVLAYRHGRDYLDPQMSEYRHRTTLDHKGLARGILTVVIFPVIGSDGGRYRLYVSNLRTSSVIDLIVVFSDQPNISQRFNSITTRPSVKEVPESEDGGGFRLDCPTQPIQTAEGAEVILQCRLHPALDLTACTVDVRRPDRQLQDNVVLAYRHGRDYLDPQMSEYRHRTTLDHRGLARGILTVVIFPVIGSDGGRYRLYVSNLRTSSVIDLVVVFSDQPNISQRFNSITTRPSVEEVPESEDGGGFRLDCPTQPIQTAEGAEVILQCRLHPALDLTACTVDVRRPDRQVQDNVVLAYRHGRDYLDPQMSEYRHRTTLDHRGLARGILTVVIFPVIGSDGGRYRLYVSNLRTSSVIDLVVVFSDQPNISQRFNSITTRPSVEEVPESEDGGGFRLDCPTQPIQTAEGAEVILQCRLHPALDLTACTVDVRRPDRQLQDNVVLAYRHGRDYLDPQMSEYRHRTTLDHRGLARGILTVVIFPVIGSDGGRYRLYVSNLRTSSVIDLVVVFSDQPNISQRFNSITTRPSVEEVPESEDGGGFRLDCPTQPIQTAEGAEVILQCRLHSALDLTACTVDVRRPDRQVQDNVVLAYRHGRDYLDPQMSEYRHRTTLDHKGLARGILTVVIFPVIGSDGGRYRLYVSNLRTSSVIDLVVVFSDQPNISQRFNSITTRPSVKEVPESEDGGGFRLDCPTQPIQTAEGAEVILQCRLHPALDLTACTVDVRRPDRQVQDNVVLAYRHGRDYLDPQMSEYRHRTTLDHRGLARGILTVVIFPVIGSDGGRYRLYVSNLRTSSVIDLVVVFSDQPNISQRFNSITTRPSVEEVPESEDGGGFRLDCPTQLIQTAEGAEVILQCRLHPALDLTACTVDVRRPDRQVQDNVVLAYRHGRDYLDPQMSEYRHRTTLDHRGLARGILTVVIFPVIGSDGGRYRLYVSNLRTSSVIDLVVEKTRRRLRGLRMKKAMISEVELNPPRISSMNDKMDVDGRRDNRVQI